MSDLLLMKLVHVLCLAYWLGADLGVFYSSYFVANDKLSPETRSITAKILFALDQGPRICMTMMLPSGIHLAWRMRLFEFDGSVMTLIWLAAFAWLAMVVTLHLARPSPAKTFLTRFDFWFRLTLATALVVLGATGLLTTELGMPHWLAWKVLIFGGLVGCGLVIRIKLRPFGPAFAQVVAGKAGDVDNNVIRSSLSGTRPFVLAIWAGIIASSAFGLHLI